MSFRALTVKRENIEIKTELTTAFYNFFFCKKFYFIMISSNDLELVNFFIFNPKYGQREGEEYKKILFYYPNETNKDVQLKNAGLCEALIKFTESFKPDKPCQNFHTKKSKQFFFEAEKEFWLVMTIGAPVQEINNDDNCSKEKSDSIQENVFDSILKKCYKIFKLFYGSFNSILSSSDDGLNILKQKLSKFYDSYLSELKIANCDILDVFQGMSYLPLRKEPFLHVQCFVNLVETKFKFVKHSAFLFNDQLIWSGICPEDMQIIYHYLIFKLLPPEIDLEVQDGFLFKELDSEVYSHYNTRSLVTKSFKFKNPKINAEMIPKVYLTSDNNVEIFYFLVYQYLSATLCLFIEETSDLSIDIFRNLDSYLSNYLSPLVTEIAEHCQKNTSITSSSSEGSPKVLYFNKLNLAQKSTMHLQSRRNVSKNVPGDILKMISDLNIENSEENAYGEVICQTLNDCWLVGKYSNSREFYVAFIHKKENLNNITDEVKKLCESQLKEIFFTE
ncbi:conserved hypothetical protein [Pediculus humanus corporis]|uniref:CCZ1/INTU/HSP4 first Longin domain-containing protein n=1 Tax=Pediculus humanus subsp. corporis TaxID=121224 RepID=E0V9H4_PEDHC|nr:uncharacterized protein Phum_PHUM011790 [Pediculus humanus corporis]EEB10030.1 conserved hypothetical protein [Pediculus humanus corporis]